MKIYLVEQDAVDGYDTYDSFVCVAENEESASKINPSGFYTWSDEHESWMLGYAYKDAEPDDCGTWSLPEQVTVTLLGSASQGVEQGVVCASFNAG